MNLHDRIDLYKSELDKIRPFEGDMLKQIRSYYRVGLTWSSNAIEGNTLTESETKVLLEDGLTVGGKSLRDTFEALGHAQAYDFMFTLLGKHEISESDVLTLHRMFYKDIDEANAGVYRSTPVIITGSKYPVCAVDEIPGEMAKLFAWANGERVKYHPVEFAAELHRRFHSSVCGRQWSRGALADEYGAHTGRIYARNHPANSAIAVYLAARKSAQRCPSVQ